MDIKLSKTNIRKQLGGSLLSTVLALGRTFVPTIAKTLGLSALAGAASEGASQIVKKISGKGVQTGGFLIPQNKIDQLIAYKHLLTTKQKKDILNALQTGSGVHIKPTKVQTGGFLGTLLASIGVPLAIEAIKKMTGKGAPQMGQPKQRPPRSIPNPTTVNNQDGGLLVPMYRTPPFYGNWPDQTLGMGTVASTGTDLLIHHGIPWLGKKAVEMGRYYGSEALRNPKLQKKAIDYALDKLNPMIQNVGSRALDQLSTKIRPNRKYKTDRKDLDGAGVDIHKLIGKIPKPKAGWTPGNYKYMGPYNPLDKQLEYDRNTGEVTKWHVQPYNKVDEIAAHHDICYDIGKNKGECDKKMVKSLDEIPYGQMPKWGQTARFLINTKQKLGLGVKQRKTKNGKGRRVKKTGKKN